MSRMNAAEFVPTFPLWMIVTAGEALLLGQADGPLVLPLFSTIDAARAFRQRSGRTQGCCVGIHNAAGVLAWLDRIPSTASRVLLDPSPDGPAGGVAFSRSAFAGRLAAL